ncbi:WD40-repeat-containing domain protein [Flagelloscypha sp. PMI_526]|nr:WD40-repeat-containing domain protein [Flagelloscypha sp. PMI_526]
MPKRKRPLALLSIDGCPRNSLGPISQISIAENILSHYQFDCSEDGVGYSEDDSIGIGDMFDLIIGTGTGGLVACMLAVLKMNITEAKTAYIRFCESALRAESKTKQERGEDLKRALENLLDGVDVSAVGSGRKISCIKMKDIEELASPCKFAVTVMTCANTSSPIILRAYRGRSASVNCTLLEALLATLSDADTFPSVEIENEEFISANIGHLNPSEDLLHEVTSIFCDDAITTIVSIGPGRPLPVSVRDSGFSQAVHDHAELCQAASERMSTRFSRYQNLWFRFEVDTLQPDPKADWGAVVSHSRIYSGRAATQDLFRALSSTLIRRPVGLKVVDLFGLEPGALQRIERGVDQATSRVENIYDDWRLRDLEVKWSASYNSADINHLYPRLCTMGTRKILIERIESWVKDAHQYSHISLCWITGHPGTGKSTILRTMCKRLDKERLLVESYFCSIQLPSKDSKYIFPTIALRLSSYFPSFRKHLIAKLQKEPSCAYAPLEGQFRELLCAAWTEASLENRSRSPFVVVIDALDECDGGDEILSLLIDCIENGGLRGLKFLVSSRPMRSLVERFRRLHYQPLLELDNVDTVEVSKDIGRFLSESLNERLQASQIDQLIILTHGLFIFASTLIKYLLPSSGFPDYHIQRKYQNIMEQKEKSLNTLYEVILVEALSPDSSGFKERLRVLHTISFVKEASSASVIADIIGVTIPKILSVARSLHPVLSVTAPDDPILVIHKSFYDFIISRLDGPFEYSSLSHHELTLSCLSQMNRLRFNICNIQSSFTMDEDLEQPPINSIGRTLEYACQHWWEHFQMCTENDQQNIENSIEQFLMEKGLFWIETMILLGNERRCRDVLIEIASSPLRKKNFESTLRPLVLELSDIVSRFMTISPKMTSHLYLSVLSLWEGKSIDRWKQHFYNLPRVLSRRIDGGKNCMVSMNVGSRVKSVAFSLDGTRIVSGSDDKCVRIWDAQSSLPLNELNGHRKLVNSVAFSPDGTRIVSGSKDKSVRIWDAQSGRQLNKLNGHRKHVNSVAFSSDGTLIVSGSNDSSVRIWDAQSGLQLNKLNGHHSCVNSVAFSSDGTRIVSGSFDKCVRIWDAQSGRQLKKLNGHRNCVNSVAFSPDGTCIVSGSYDHSVRIWDALSGRQLNKLDSHRGCATSVAFSPDGTRIVSGSDDKCVRIWDAQSGRQLNKLDDHRSCVTSVAFSPDGTRIVSGSYDDSVRIWDALSGHQLNKLNGHHSHVNSVAFSPDDTRIVSGSWDYSVYIWDVQSGRQLKKLNGHQNCVNSVAFSPDGTCIISGSWDKSVCIWDVQSGRQLKKLNGHQNCVSSVAFSPDGTCIISGSWDKSVCIWDAQSGLQLNKLDGHRKHVNSVAFSPDGTRIISGSSDKSVRIWDAQSGLQLNTLNGHQRHVNSVAFSSDSTRIVSGSNDKSVRIWDAQSGRQLNKLNGHGQCVISVSFSPDGTRIVSGSSDNSARIWDAQSGHQLNKLDGHGHWVSSVAFSPDGTRIVCGSDEKCIRVWDAEHLHKLSDCQLNDNSGLLYPTIQFSTHLQQHYAEPDLETTHTDPLFFPVGQPHVDSSNLPVLQLNPISNSYHTRDDGWVVTSLAETGVELKLLWLPPSLRPFYPALLMEISDSGFNRIDLSGCTFGNGWFNISGEGHEQLDTSARFMRPTFDPKKQGLRSGNVEQNQTMIRAIEGSVSGTGNEELHPTPPHTVEDSLSGSTKKISNWWKGMFN